MSAAKQGMNKKVHKACAHRLARINSELDDILERVTAGYSNRSGVRRHQTTGVTRKLEELRSTLSKLARSEWGPEFDPYNQDRPHKRNTHTIRFHQVQSTDWPDVEEGEPIIVLFRAFDVTGCGPLPCPACSMARVYYRGKREQIRCTSCRAIISIEPQSEPDPGCPRRVEIFVHVPSEEP